MRIRNMTFKFYLCLLTGLQSRHTLNSCIKSWADAQANLPDGQGGSLKRMWLQGATKRIVGLPRGGFFSPAHWLNHVPVQVAVSLLKGTSPIYFDYLQGDSQMLLKRRRSPRPGSRLRRFNGDKEMRYGSPCISSSTHLARARQ